MMIRQRYFFIYVCRLHLEVLPRLSELAVATAAMPVLGSGVRPELNTMGRP